MLTTLEALFISQDFQSVSPCKSSTVQKLNLRNYSIVYEDATWPHAHPQEAMKSSLHEAKSKTSS